mgnify:FL=1
MLHNRFAGEALKKVQKLYEAGIEMNGQIVVCPGWNDGEHLRRSIEDLMDIGFNSCSVVPVGLTKFRKGLARLEPVTKEKAGEIIDLVDEYGAKCLEKYGTRMFFCADEFYIKAERPLPGEEYYEEYQQLDNGVGMLRSTMNEFLSGLEDAESGDVASFTVATGKAAEPFIARLVAEAKKKFPQLRGEVVGIVNDFFGHTITVSGLVTAQDLIAQLKDRPTLGERVLIPANMLRHGEGVFLDDYTVEQVEQALGRRLTISETDGYSLCDAIFRQELGSCSVGAEPECTEGIFRLLHADSRSGLLCKCNCRVIFRNRIIVLFECGGFALIRFRQIVIVGENIFTIRNCDIII